MDLINEPTIESRPSRIGTPGLGRPTRVLAAFFYGGLNGEHASGSARRFLEVSRQLSAEGISLSTLDYCTAPTPSMNAWNQYLCFPGGWEPISLRYLANIFRISLFSVVWGRRLRCDLVYSTDNLRNQLIPASFASGLLRKPLVVVVHSLHVDELRTTLRDLFRNQLRTKGSLKKALASTIVEILIRLGYRRATAFLAVSGWTAKLVAKEFRSRPVIVAGNGVGDQWFGLAHTPKTQDACYLGMISPEKRQQLLIRSWKEVSAARPDATLVLVGERRDREYASQCETLIDDLGLRNNVIMTGFVTDAKAREWVSSSRIFISASQWEGFGLSILEAMAAGLPCVLSDISPLREIFGDAALLVNSPTPHVWADRVLRLLEDGDEQARLSDAGRRLAGHYRWDKVSRVEADLIRSLCSPRARGAIGSPGHP